MTWSRNKVGYYNYVGVGVYVLYQSCASSSCAQFYGASPLKHQAMDMQRCPKPDHYPASEPAVGLELSICAER